MKLGSGCRHTSAVVSLPPLSAQTWAVCARVLQVNTDVCVCLVHTGYTHSPFYLFPVCSGAAK